MARKIHLTSGNIESINFSTKPILVYDLEETNLYIRISKTKKTWYCRYRLLNGKTNQKKLGEFPEISVSQARVMAKEIKSDVEQGINPKAKKAPKKLRQTIIFNDLLDQYINAHLPTKRPSTQRTYKYIIGSYIKPALGKYYVDDISRGEISELTEYVYHKTSEYNATLLRNVLSGIFEYAIQFDFADSNPTSKSISFQSELESRDRFYDEKEIRSLFYCLDEVEQPMKDLFQVLFYTGKRKLEVYKMQWDHIDMKSQVWTIPKQLVKTYKEDRVYLCDTIFDKIILPRYEHINRSKIYVFPAKNDKNKIFKNTAYQVKKIKLGSGINEFRLHDIRRTITYILAKNRVSQNIIDKVLNNASSSRYSIIRNVYNRYDYFPEYTEAIVLLERELNRIINDEQNAGEFSVSPHKPYMRLVR